MTKEQRKIMYIDAYERIASKEFDFMCHAIMGARYSPSLDDVIVNYPEFYALSPSDRKIKNKDEWMPEEKRNTRLTILAFCIAMS